MTFKIPQADQRATAGGADINSSRLTLSLSGTNLERAGDYNQRIVLQAIRLMNETTRSELARVTGLTAPTIANITAKLSDLGFVKPAGRLQGKRGQPAMRIVINPNGAFSIGLNIDRDHITLVTLDLAGRIRSRRSREVAFALPAEVVEYVRETLPELLKEGGVDRKRVLGVGVALPDDLGRITLPHRPKEYDQWCDADISKILGDVLPWPIYADNDAASAAQGEAHLGNGLAVPSFFYLLISAGLGSGLVIDRSYVRGANSRSGEIWAMPDIVNGEGRTVQDTVSLSALYDRLEQAGHSVECPNSLLDESPERQAIVNGWIDDAARVLVQPLIAVNCLIDPATILIGGRLPGQIADVLVDRLNALMSACDIPAIAPVRRADTADDAAAIGAALMPFLDSVLPSESILMQAGRQG